MLDVKKTVKSATPVSATAETEAALATTTGPKLPDSELITTDQSKPVLLENRRLWGSPELLTSACSNHTPSQIAKLNQSIVAAWTQGDPAAWIIARVLFQELKMTVPEYMKVSALDKPNSLYHVLKPLTERAKQGGLRDETYAALLQDWKTLPELLQKDCQPVLDEAAQRLKKYLLGKDAGTPFGLIRSWALEVGPAEFEHKTNCNLSALRKGRHNRSRFLSYSEFVVIGQDAGILPRGESALKLWDSELVKPIKKALWNEAQKFYRSKAVATALMIVEAAGAKTVEELHQNPLFTLPWSVARSLHQYDLLPWKKVAPAITALVQAHELSPKARSNLRNMWRKEEAELQNKVTFASRFRETLGEQQISVQSILKAMQVDQQSEIGDPKELLRFALEHELRYAALPIGVLAFFSARSPDEAQELLELKRTEIRQTLLRRDRGSSDPHPIRIERDLWSVSLDDLGDAVAKERVQATEWRRRTPLVLAEKECDLLVQHIKLAGLEKAEAALSNWVEENRTHPAWKNLNIILRTYPGFSIAEFQKKMLSDLSENSDIAVPESILDSMPASRLQAILYGDDQTFADTNERIELYHERANLGLPIFHEGDTRKTRFE